MQVSTLVAAAPLRALVLASFTGGGGRLRTSVPFFSLIFFPSTFAGEPRDRSGVFDEHPLFRHEASSFLSKQHNNLRTDDHWRSKQQLRLADQRMGELLP